MDAMPVNGQTSEQRAEYNRKYYADPANKLKRRARDMVQSRILSGKLVRQPCEQCSAVKTHAHHEDYSKPLEIIWLCHFCHAARHPPSSKARRVNHHANSQSNVGDRR